MLSPKDRSPYHTANRPPVSNQRPPEILDVNIRREGRGETQGAGGDWGWGQKARGTRGECAPSSFWLHELL